MSNLESLKIRPTPLYISADTYLDCRHAHPHVDWLAFESRLEIQISRNAEGKLFATVHEDTPAAKAIREAMTAAYP